MSDAFKSELFLKKAEESVAGAESEHANHRYQNCANRSLCMLSSGRRGATSSGNQPNRGSMESRNRAGAVYGRVDQPEKWYSSELRDTFERLIGIRHMADHQAQLVSEIQSARARRSARAFVSAIQKARGTQP